MCVSLVMGSVAFDDASTDINSQANETTTNAQPWNRTMRVWVLILLTSYIAGVAADEIRQASTIRH